MKRTGLLMENGCSHSINITIAFGLNGICMQTPKNRLEKELLHIPAICAFHKIINHIVLGAHQYKKATSTYRRTVHFI